MALMTTYVTHARRWQSDSDGGWELYVDGVGVTQVEELRDAESQVRDLVRTFLDASPIDFDVQILVEDQVP
jgi:Rps23 Pro-64 3,4-dihydroxylase Tpa1-like proline 4-hydroxylase